MGRMLIRRKLPPGAVAVGLLCLLSLGAALGRRAATAAAAARSGRNPLPVEAQSSPLPAVLYGAEIAILLPAFATAFGLFRFHAPSRRAFNCLLALAILLLLYKGVQSAMHEAYRLLIPYGAALAGILAALFTFNRADVAEMYRPAWAGHDVPVLPLSPWIPAAAAAAGLGVGVVLQRSHDELRQWLMG